VQIITVFHNNDAIAIENYFRNVLITRNLFKTYFINYLFKYDLDMKDKKIVHY